jgi:hypothetical protein
MATLVRTVVLACAKQRRADLGAVVEVLAGRGNAVEVVSGIEANPLPWEQVVARIGPNAIYVVCGDDVLTLERIAGLRATLQRGNVPLKHIWAGPINWAEPVQVLRHADQLLRMANGQMTQPLPQPPSEASGRTVLAPPPPRTAPPPLLPMNAAPPTHPMPTPMAGAPEPPIVVEGLGHRKPLLFAGAGVLLMGVILTAVLWGGDDDEPAKVAEATAAAKKDEAKPAAKTAKPAAKTAKPAKEEEPAKQVDAAAPEPAKEAEPTPSPSPAPSPSPEPEDEPEVVAVAAEADAVAMPTSQGGGGGLGDVGEDPIVAEALRSQAIRALDILLISPEARVQKRRNWKLARHRFADAARHCDELVVAGVDGWRLPNIGELRSLTTANILGRNATYWSDTKGDTYGNTRVIWAVHSHRMHSIGANSRGARTICVRDAV